MGTAGSQLTDFRQCATAVGVALPSANSSNLITHLYGLFGLIPGIAGLIVAYRADAPWSEFVLLGAGWFASIIFAAMVFRCFGLLTKAYEENGRLEEINHSLRRELDGRNSVLEYLVGINQGKTATPRTIPAHTAPPENEA